MPVLNRVEVLDRLIDRDGMECAYPGCTEILDLSVEDYNNPKFVTIDHWFPQVWARTNGWSWEEINGLNNLRAMTKKCNAKKGNSVPNEDGTLPVRTRKTFAQRRLDRKNRPEVCNTCNSGRNLDYDEVCAVCGSGPQPERFPSWAQMKPNECTHEGPWSCWACITGIVARQPAIVDVLDGSHVDD